MLAFLFGAAPVSGLRAVLRRGDREAVRAVIREHMALARKIGGIRLDVRGEEHVPKNRSFVVVFNQSSVAEDVGNAEVLLPYVDRFVLAAEYAWLPLVRRACEEAGYVFLERGNRRSTTRALDELTEVVASGGSISMAPEGHLSRDGTIGHFKRGAFLVAIRAGALVVPMALRGGHEILKPGSMRYRPGVLRYRIGKPLDTAGLEVDQAPDIAARARERVVALFQTADAS
ncbi:MAG: 1-acyl-sn-glycerol-3-phosphate acyltransferase [Deltaproteobacteria bacterium]|jgi:1-acyl-sn-glycerol-3-phosphate acyltransferase|nr:1-acyl-sn-glycerol-3-phosphate acyltransferase [Deltaproteobacteria bacterium]